MLPLILSVLLSHSANASQVLLGSAEAPIQILVYGEFQCSDTQRFLSYLPRLKAETKADYAITFAHYPLARHEQARPAALAAICADQQNKFSEFVQALTGHEHDLGREFYLASAKTAGVGDLNRFTLCLDSAEAARVVVADQMSGRAMKLKAVPHVIINGRAYEEGFKTFKEMKKAVESAK